MHRLQGKSKDTQNWWNTFQTAKYPAYVTLVNPDIIEDLRKPRSRVKHVLLDDVLHQREYKHGCLPATIEIKEGSFVLVLPDNASTARAHCVSPPWLCRVNSIWFVPGDKSSSHLDPKGTSPEVREWERTQIEQGRIAAHHFELQVTYFYRWPDFHDAIRDHPLSTGRLSQALQNLGVAETDQQVQALRSKRGCGNTPATHFSMRYVMYSNHETTAASDTPDGKGSDVDEENSPVPVESVMATAQVLFLDSKAKLPYLSCKAPAATAAAPGAAAAAVSRGKAALPVEQREALAAKRRQLVPGFICNLFLVTPEAAGAAPKLFGLSEWANGSAGANVRGVWVTKSRKQVQQLLQDTKAELKAATAAAKTAQQQLGRTAAAVPSDDDDAILSDFGRDSEQKQQQHHAEDDDVDLISTEDLAVAAAPSAAAAGRKAGHAGCSRGGMTAAAVVGHSGRGRGATAVRRRVVMEASSEENASAKEEEEDEEEEEEVHDEAEEEGQEFLGEQAEEEEEEEEVRSEQEQDEDEDAGSSDDGGVEGNSSDNSEHKVTAAAVRSGGKQPLAATAAASRQQHGMRQQKMQRSHRKQQQHDKSRSCGRRKRSSAAAPTTAAAPLRKQQKRKTSSRVAARDSGGSEIVIDSD